MSESNGTVLRKHELEGALAQESLMIKSGKLRDENPLDKSPPFREFLSACRNGDLRKCQELINKGVNVNGKDEFDYTPLIIASLCGHFELVQLLLEAGALAERNTFQGERCIYNALNDRIRNLLLKYDFSKSSDPYVYWSTHISSLLNSTMSDIELIAGSDSFEMHKFILASRTPYFEKKLQAQPETTSWKLAPAVPVEALTVALRYVYLGALPRDIVPPGSSMTEEEVLKGLDKISKQLEIEQLWEAIMAGGDRRLARQRYQDEVERAMRQVDAFFQQNVLGKKMVVDTDRVDEVKWKHDNSIFADVLLRADESSLDEDDAYDDSVQTEQVQSIPIGPAGQTPTNGDAPGRRKKPTKSYLYPAHRAMLIRSEYFHRMFSGDFVEARKTENLRIVKVDCEPEVLELILRFLYTENTDHITLDFALDLLYAADMLFLDTLKTKAAAAIANLGSSSKQSKDNNNPKQPQQRQIEDEGEEEVIVEPINIYDVIHAAWDLRVQRLEEFAARYLADRLEDYIDEPDFQELIRESADRLRSRQETDTIELLDDIRYYLGERFRLRFEDVGFEEIIDENGEPLDEHLAAEIDAALANPTGPREPASNTAEGTAAAAEANRASGQQVHAKDGGQDEATQEEAVRTLDGEMVEDEFESDAVNYRVLLDKIDAMLDRLKLDA